MYLINNIDFNIEKTLQKLGLKSRPNASTGFWISFLLPIAILLSLIKNAHILSPIYKLATITSTGIFISNIIFLTQCVKQNNFKINTVHYFSTVFTTFLFYTCLHNGYLFSVYSGIFATILYYKCLPFILKVFPSSFTFGEASLVAQSLILFLYTSTVNIYNSILHAPEKTGQISTLILQVGIIGFGIIAYCIYAWSIFRKPFLFYGLTTFVFTFFIILPLHVLLQQSPVLWIINLLFSKKRTIHVILFWLVCIFLSTVVLNNQIKKGQKANTFIRKIFHILIFVVYLTGLIDQCSVLYLASGIILVFFLALETVRKLNLPPLGCYLQDGFIVMMDEKDAGNLALTPMYLLIGCSIPLWIHPDTCDVTDSAGFHLLPLISGILSIGIGDTFASTFGTKFGRYRWSKSKKTFEGTIACIFSQMVVIFLLMNSGYIFNSEVNVAKSGLAIVVTSLVEAKTDQIDNGILPLIMYILLL